VFSVSRLSAYNKKEKINSIMRQRNTPYKLPVKKDNTRFYMKPRSKNLWYSWTIRNNHKSV